MRHIDHIELTWKLLGDAFGQLEKTLSGMATAAGKPEKYDRELTRAFFDLIAQRRREGESWDDFMARNPDLLTRGRELVTAARVGSPPPAPLRTAPPSDTTSSASGSPSA
jgi:hypothetical protein